MRDWHSAEQGCLPEQGGRTAKILKERGTIKEGENNCMTEKSFMTVEEVAAELRVSKSKAYQIVRELNAELQKQGYLTVAGRVNATFFHKKVCYSD